MEKLVTKLDFEEDKDQQNVENGKISNATTLNQLDEDTKMAAG